MKVIRIIQGVWDRNITEHLDGLAKSRGERNSQRWWLQWRHDEGKDTERKNNNKVARQHR